MGSALENAVKNQTLEYEVKDKQREVQIKRQFFEKRMERVNESLKKASSQQDVDRFKKIREMTLRKVNKYTGKNFTS